MNLPVRGQRDAVLALIAGDPCHARDRAVIVAAIRESVRPDGTTSSNAWRPALVGRVYPGCVGAVVHALIRRGVLAPTGRWEWSDDTRSRNVGKPVPTWRWIEPAARSLRGAA